MEVKNYFSQEQVTKARRLLAEDKINALAFLVFDVIFAHPEFVNRKNDFLTNTRMTDWIERSIRKYTLTLKEVYQINHLNIFIHSTLFGLETGVYTKESEFELY